MKKAILVVSFGTTHHDTRRVTIDRIEGRVKENFEDFEVRRAYTAHGVIKVLKDRDGIEIDTPEEAMEKLIMEGFEEIVVQPLHIIPGVEYDYISEVVRYYGYENPKINIKLGRPVLYYKGYEEGQPDDYTTFIEAVKSIIDTKETVLFMGHGTMHPSNACYLCLQEVLRSQGHNNIYIASVEGYPTIEDVTKTLLKNKDQTIRLVPLMLVAGDHAKNDMAGHEEDSWKSLLTKAGFQVEICLMGLGEIEKFQDIYLQHISDAIEDRYKDLGRNIKGKKLLKAGDI
ncbi:sirohydrochlorin cobaltochelatase [Clostridium bovifaecis]|uniref:Sirohydrochlorin cobaltochelatase n=1 Tax=Clostridium bovifaecis TaxID=2184719 RepID=A0A6I6EU89_9CLOT|nr:sirohydrochlorin cobaltochelatase [Clostridium bovifaecis]